MDLETAIDEMLSLVNKHWSSETPAVNDGDVAELVFDETGNPKSKKHDAPWARVTVRHNDGQQRSMGTRGNRRFERSGQVIIQVFAPKSEGVTLRSKLGKIAIDSLEGNSTPGGVWFRNVRAQELGPDGAWSRVNVVADFSYDEIK